MNEYQINPIDLMPFIGVPRDPEKQKKKLIQLYENDAKEALDKGDKDAYILIQEKIKSLQEEDNNNQKQ